MSIAKLRNLSHRELVKIHRDITSVSLILKGYDAQKHQWIPLAFNISYVLRNRKQKRQVHGEFKKVMRLLGIKADDFHELFIHCEAENIPITTWNDEAIAEEAAEEINGQVPGQPVTFASPEEAVEELRERQVRSMKDISFGYKPPATTEKKE